MNKRFLLIGIICFLLPITLQVVDKNRQYSVIDTYQKEVEEQEEDTLVACFEHAKAYNKTLYELKKSSVGQDVTLDYSNQLNVTSTGMMGHLEIPKINLNLPIYHGTSEDVLTTGIGHLEGTSLPVGGENVHTVLTGHCGLPSAQLFTRLDEIKEGDHFTLHICNQKLEYEVNEIRIVKPDQVDVIAIEEGKDQASLITCTPYGINTHRLIVTGERIEETEKETAEMTAEGGVDEKIYNIMGIGTLFFLLFICRCINRKFRYFDK